MDDGTEETRMMGGRGQYINEKKDEGRLWYVREDIVVVVVVMCRPPLEGAIGGKEAGINHISIMITASHHIMSTRAEKEGGTAWIRRQQIIPVSPVRSVRPCLAE